MVPQKPAGATVEAAISPDAITSTEPSRTGVEKGQLHDAVQENILGDLDPEKELPDQTAQNGVQQAEAVNIIWSKISMRLVFAS